jgi:hypothetical protein
MENNRDTTIAATQNGNPRHWLNEASGLITLTPESGTALRVPVYAVARPGSTMSTTQAEIAVSGATTSGDLELTGAGVSTGLLGPNEHNSLVTAFELQGISPQIETPPAGVAASALNADLQYIGATANASTIFFGITTWRDFGTPASDIEFDIWIDTDGDGVNDYVAYNTRLTDSDIFVTQLVEADTFAPVSLTFTNIFNASIPTAAMNNNVIVMPVPIAALNMPGDSTQIDYYVEAYSRFSTKVDTFPAVDDGYLTFDFANLGLDFSAGDPAAFPAFIDMPSNTVPFEYNAANYLANNSLGALLLHHYNTAGTRAEVLPIVPEVSFTAPPTNKTYGDAPFSVSATASTGQDVTYSSTTPAVCTVAGNEVTIVAAGDCVIAAEAVATTNFAPARTETTIPIAKAPLTVTVNDATRLVGAPNPAFTVTYAGFVLDETAAVLDGTLSFTTTATGTSPAGNYAVTAGGLTADNYAITFVDGTLRIEGFVLFLPILAK